ncbi:plastocyanin/azurin family copper-binding protein [Mesorhizobium sp.]|uniref:cupredoxin domain-containing protein n=1 Tax=Mesorhizobium sp. TaxID=1871066 RepID=UPI001219150C|nr:plastocyanin/azurin family copper-binding protein [Mesorhizobium sp.]TIS55603.1 MAG: copper oxidase [Mesorhizobium sp.]TIS87899.1 MAG: copper oxidase [Mesorhizobium sp.]
MMPTVAMVLFAAPALATGMHSGIHEMMTIGQPGAAAKVDRTISIGMLENEDGSMAFDPVSVTVKRGETVRLAFTNEGKYDHEFVMDTHEQVMEHKAGMERLPDMEHADLNAIRIGPQGKGEIVWTFTNPGQFDFACLIPGHYDLGMRGSLTVTAN